MKIRLHLETFDQRILPDANPGALPPTPVGSPAALNPVPQPKPPSNLEDYLQAVAQFNQLVNTTQYQLDQARESGEVVRQIRIDIRNTSSALERERNALNPNQVLILAYQASLELLYAEHSQAYGQFMSWYQVYTANQQNATSQRPALMALRDRLIAEGQNVQVAPFIVPDLLTTEEIIHR
jgi:hypothetical protein